jgi:hypothetical protein
MPNLNQLAIDLPQNATWIAVGVGAVLTLLVLALGYLLLDRREAAKLVPRPASPSVTAPAVGRAAHPQYDPFVDGSALEQRTALRRKGNPVLVQIAAKEAKAEPASGWVVDRSTTGLCLLVGQAFAVGTVLCVKPSDAPRGTIWVQIEVKNCRQKGSNWEIGCQFLQPPPWGIMLLFG